MKQIKPKRILRLLLIGLLLSSVNPIYSQKLKQGDVIPAFETFDVFDNSVNLSQNNQSKTFLAFMRYAGCPVCNFRTHELIENYEKLEALGYNLIVIYESESETLKSYLEETPVPFTVIGDPDRILYDKFGVKSSLGKTLKSGFNKNVHDANKEGSNAFGISKPKRDGKLTGIPADFLISKTGIVETAHYGQTIADHLLLTKIIKPND